MIHHNLFAGIIEEKRIHPQGHRIQIL